MNSSKGRRPNSCRVVLKCGCCRTKMRIRQVSSMSPNTNTNTNWDPSSLRLDQDGARRSQGGTRRGRQVSPIRGKFIAGPVDVKWVCQASQLGVKALLVGLALWHLKGLRK